MTCVLAIDQGTTGTTCLVIGQNGRILGRAYREITQHYPAPGWVEHDAHEILDRTVAAAREAIADAGVDPIAVIEIQRIVRFLKSRGIGVLITDHNVRETLGICDRAYIISEGKVLTTGKPEDISNDASVRKVYLGEHFKM